MPGGLGALAGGQRDHPPAFPSQTDVQRVFQTVWELSREAGKGQECSRLQAKPALSPQLMGTAQGALGPRGMAV